MDRQAPAAAEEGAVMRDRPPPLPLDPRPPAASSKTTSSVPRDSLKASDTDNQLDLGRAFTELNSLLIPFDPLHIFGCYDEPDGELDWALMRDWLGGYDGLGRS